MSKNAQKAPLIHVVKRDLFVEAVRTESRTRMVLKVMDVEVEPCGNGEIEFSTCRLQRRDDLLGP